MLKNYFPKIVTFLENMEAGGRVRQVTDDSMAHAHCMLDT
jgi:hypothetical protein